MQIGTHLKRPRNLFRGTESPSRFSVPGNKFSGRLGVSALLLFSLVGCIDNNPPPPRVLVPETDNRSAQVTRQQDVNKPIRETRGEIGTAIAGYDDPPLIDQQLPEQPAFVDAYRKVGAPRIVLFVNRTLDGKILSEEGASGGRNDGQAGGYLHPGQYDEADAKNIDYGAIEVIMTDWLSCSGQVTIVSPTMARQKLTEDQIKNMQLGRPQVMSDLARQLDADILVQVQARPTHQTQQGLQIRILAEATNIRDGLSISRAVVDVQPPLEKTTLNRYTRFMTRKLVDGMMQTWSAPPPPTSDAGPTQSGTKSLTNSEPSQPKTEIAPAPAVTTTTAPTMQP